MDTQDLARQFNADEKADVLKRRITELMSECAEYMQENAELKATLKRALRHVEYSVPYIKLDPELMDFSVLAEFDALIADIKRLIGEDA